MSASSNKSAFDRVQATLTLDANVTSVHQVSPTRARALAKIGIGTVRDLLTNYPLRYTDLSHVTNIVAAPIGDLCTIRAQVHEVKLKRPRPRLALTEVTIVDDTGVLIVTAFRQPWLADQLKKGDTVMVAGKVEFNYGYKRMTNPDIEKLEGAGDEIEGFIKPTHPTTAKIGVGMMRRLVRNALDATQGLVDPLPLSLRAKYRLMSRNCALNCIHFPHSMEEQRQARRRLAYEELLLLELMLLQEGQERSVGREPTRHVVNGSHVQALEAALPFTLSDEQVKARREILDRMAADRVANHLLLGDVGTGKTIVAAFALAAAADSGTQALFMAPTEILARQHAQSLGPLLDAAGITYDVLTGSTPADEREGIFERAASGETTVLIGTHALFENDFELSNCTLCIIDEQQRFGVEQRKALLEKGACPDALFLTATPIPRSLAMALYGNLTLSYLTERPHGAPPRTTHVHTRDEKGAAYDAALAALKRGEQVYVICPLVGERVKNADAADAESDADEYEYGSIAIEDEVDMAGDDVAAAEAEASFLQAKVFVDYRVGLVHGKLSAAEKQEAMRAFAAGETHVLVATTVIEVGVDVPNATVLIVEDADRFGLAQLHQLRGRVGRGTLPSEVHLISNSKNASAHKRLAVMETTDNGFELASYDLSLRREGDILGNRQHGASLLKLVNVVRDASIVEAARADAEAILAEDPALELPAHQPLAREARVVYRHDSAITGG